MRSKYKPGSFLRIPLADGSFGYARTLEPPFDAFYEYRTAEPDTDLDRIASKPILFRIVVSLPYSESWKLIGWRKLEEHFSQPIVQYRQAVGPYGRCTIFDNLGMVRQAEPHECLGLEPSAALLTTLACLFCTAPSQPREQRAEAELTLQHGLV